MLLIYSSGVRHKIGSLEISMAHDPSPRPPGSILNRMDRLVIMSSVFHRGPMRDMRWIMSESDHDVFVLEMGKGTDHYRGFPIVVDPVRIGTGLHSVYSG